MLIESDNPITASLSERITADFRQKIASGAWAAGSALPTRRDLAKVYGVALRTIEQAMAPLIAEGVVDTRGAKGTFVALAGDRKIDSSRIAALSASKSGTEAQSPISFGIIGIWSGVHGENMVESVGARAIEHEAARHSNISLHYFNRYVGRSLPGSPMEDAVRSLIDEGVDGIITFTIESHFDRGNMLGGFIDVVESTGVPVVMFNRAPSHIHIRQVVYDDIYAGYEAARHLLLRDWLSLSFVAPFEDYWSDDRLKGIRQAVSSVAGSSVAVIPGPGSTATLTQYSDYHDLGYAHGKSLFRNMKEPVGIIACNDLVAYGILDAAVEADFQPGKDFAIIGFDDYVYSRARGLSSVRPPLEQMGAECVDVLLRAIRNERSPLLVALRSEVVARASTTRPREDRLSALTGVNAKELTA